MKKLVFCFDGTGNEPADADDFFSDSSISNVLKLYVLMGGKLNLASREQPQINSQHDSQHCFYYRGIGTHGGWLSKILNAAFAPVTGDMRDILSKAAEDLQQHRTGDDDEIFIFGFSRGAAIARIFASRHTDHPIKFMGVFDTVAAIKGSRDLKKETLPPSTVLFENGTMKEHIQKAAHLVSIDEKRVMFQPTLFNKDERIEEIWFAGVHSDIGGGYWFDGLSDVALEFMVSKARNEGLTILDAADVDYAAVNEGYDEGVICLDDININPLTHGKMHEQSRSGMFGKMTLAPRQVRVNVDDKPSKADIPIVHQSVKERFDKVTGYRPYALRNVRYRLNDSLDQVRHGIAGLR